MDELAAGSKCELIVKVNLRDVGVLVMKVTGIIPPGATFLRSTRDIFFLHNVNLTAAFMVNLC